MRFLPLLILSLLCTGLPWGTFTPSSLSAQTTIVCGETFYDPGGPDGDYPTDEFIEYSICPITAGEAASVTFTQVDIQSNCDELSVFNGNNGAFLGAVTEAGLSFTSTRLDGCLQVRFYADGKGSDPGFEAVTSCGQPPSCPAPANVVQESQTNSSITLSWLERGSAIQYDVYLLPVGDSPTGPPTFEGVSNPYTFTGLTANTSYDFYVRADCDEDAGNDESVRFGPIRVSTQSPPPANDLCADAVAIPVTTGDNCSEIFYTINRAGPSDPAISICGPTANPDVYFSFVAIGPSATVRIDYECTVDEGDQPPYLEVFSGSCNSLTSLGCDPRLTNLSIGSTYFIRVYDRNVGNFGRIYDFSVCVIAGEEAPVNDDCEDAVNLIVSATESCTGSNYTTLGANESLINTCGGTPDDDVWFSFTASAPDQFLFIENVTNVNDAFGRDVYYEVFSGDCGGLTSVACGEIRSFDGDPATISGLTTGNTYLMRVYSSSNPNQISFDICLATAPPPPTPPENDECAGALPIPVNADAECGATVMGTSILATRSGTDCGGGNASQDVWYSFTATRETHLLSVISSLNPNNNRFENLYVELSDGTCGATNQLQCIWATRSLVNDLTDLTVGRDYFLRVFPRGATSVTNFELCLGTPPINDECEDAIAVSVNPDLTNTVITSGTTFGGTKSFVIDGADTGCDNFGNDDDVWYRFTAISSEHRVSILNAVPRFPARGFGSETTAIVRIYDAEDACTAPMELGCGFLNGNSDEEFFSSLMPGGDYLLSVQSLGTRNDLEFDLSIKTEEVELPIQLISFTGRVSGKLNILNWSVALEENLSHYQIERSPNGINDWKTLGNTAAAGTGNGVKQYAFEDSSPLINTFYRLRSVDLDGSYELSTLVQMERSGVEGIRIYPNPSNGRFSLDLPAVDGIIELNIYEISGQLVISTTSAEGLPVLRPGLYQLVANLG